ncbi:unnamed protein product, partial [Prorocentrum cordatum]
GAPAGAAGRRAGPGAARLRGGPRGSVAAVPCRAPSAAGARGGGEQGEPRGGAPGGVRRRPEAFRRELREGARREGPADARRHAVALRGPPGVRRGRGARARLPLPRVPGDAEQRGAGEGGERGGLRRRRAAAERPRRGPGRGGAAVRPGRPRAARPGARGLHDHRGARLQRLPGRGLRDAAPVLRRGGRGTGRGGGLAGAQHGHEQRLRERHPRGLDLCAGGLPAVRAPPRPVQAVRRAATGAARAAEKASSPAPCARRGTGHADSTQSGRLLACFCSSRCCLAPLARPQLALVGLPLVRVVF